MGGSARSVGTSSMCAKRTGLAHTDQGESSGAQTANASCLFITTLPPHEQGDVRGGIVDDRRARDAGVRAGGAAVHDVDADTRVDRTVRAGDGTRLKAPLRQPASGMAARVTGGVDPSLRVGQGANRDG